MHVHEEFAIKISKRKRKRKRKRKKRRGQGFGIDRYRHRYDLCLKFLRVDMSVAVMGDDSGVEEYGIRTPELSNAVLHMK